MAVQISNDIGTRFNRAVEVWRRRTNANGATATLAVDLLTAMDEQGLTVESSTVQSLVSALVTLGYTVKAPA